MKTKRAIETRIKEHICCIKHNEPNKSAFAAHVLNTDHSDYSVSVVKNVRNTNELDAYGSYYIQSNPDCLNLDNGNIETPLFTRI